MNGSILNLEPFISRSVRDSKDTNIIKFENPSCPIVYLISLNYEYVDMYLHMFKFYLRAK